MSVRRTRQALLAERLALVLAIGEVNGAHQRAQAGASGARIEIMTLEDLGGPEATPEALGEAQARLEAVERALAETADRIAALAERLAELDRELADVEEKKERGHVV